jgi:hypothetical protein
MNPILSEQLTSIDSAIQRWSKTLGCVQASVSSLFPIADLRQAGYFEAFPQLVLLAQPAAGTDTEFALAPAVCYHLFARLANSQLNQPVHWTARGFCYRNESIRIPGRRQTEFQMREVVIIGKPNYVLGQLTAAEAFISELGRTVGLDGHWAVADDPFFCGTARGRALMQKLLQPKREFCLPDGLAIASTNRHQAFFTERFAIQSDAPATKLHSGCVAFGLDRWAHAIRDLPSKSKV